MKKISYLALITFVFSVFINYANAEISEQQARNVKVNYQYYLNRLRSCSPYTYNTDGDRTISKIVGVYNRRCIVRMYTYDTTMECVFKPQELKKFTKSMPSSDVYLENLKKVSTAADAKLSENAKYKAIQEYLDSGICKSDGADENNKK